MTGQPEPWRLPESARLPWTASDQVRRVLEQNQAASAIADAVRVAARNYHDTLEQACEAAIAGGQHGVSIRTVLRHTPGGGLSYLTTASVDPAVPYGHIHEYRDPIEEER